MEIEPKGLDFSSALTQTYTDFFLVLPFLFFSKCRPTLDFQAPKTHEQIKSKTNQTHSPSLEAFGAWVAEFLHCCSDETRPISTFCIAWSFRRLGLVRSVPRLPVFASLWWRDMSNLCILHRLKLSPPALVGFCIVVAARHDWSLRFALPEAFTAWVWSELPHRCFFLLRCSSLRFELSRLLGFCISLSLRY